MLAHTITPLGVFLTLLSVQAATLIQDPPPLAFVDRSLADFFGNADNSSQLTVSRSRRQAAAACKEYEWQCSNGQCINTKETCDGVADCSDDSDETLALCSAFECPGYLMRCAYGACVDYSAECDGIFDCVDGSDENPIKCARWPGWVPQESAAAPIPESQSTERPTTPDSITVVSGGCELPDFPPNGRYTVSNYGAKQIIPGDVVSPFTILTYTCEEGFDLTAPLSSCQEGNVWSAMPECTSPCAVPTSYTVDFMCYMPTGSIACSATLPSGATILSKCKNGHIALNKLLTLTCRSGTWDNPTPECILDCGLEKAFSIPLVVRGTPIKKDTFPWHVAIFQDTGEPVPEQICGGSLVRAHLVISAAHCFYNPFKNVKIDARYYKVACGKFYRSWDNANDSILPYVQRSEVKQIILHKAYRGDEQNHQNDVAILVLATPFKLSDSVRPICIDLDNQKFNRMQVESGSLGKVAGWGLTETGHSSEELRSLKLPVVGFSECRPEMDKYRFSRYLTSDKLCAGYTNGSALCQGDSGGGLVFPDYRTNTTRWYLRGVVSIGPVNEEMNSCRPDTYTAFTKIFKLRGWLRVQLRLLITSTAVCQLPDFPSDGGYTVYNYGIMKSVPGDIVSQSTTLTYFCKQDFEPTTPLSLCQENNTWSAAPECNQRCTMPTSYTVDFSCFIPTGPIPCWATLPSGSTVHSRCKNGHVAQEDLSVLTCRGGSWGIPTPECSPDCGLEKAFNITHVLNSTTVKNDTFPWHVAIFRDSLLKQICGGSLVRAHLVISAAHCFYDTVNNVQIDARYYTVACGKFYRPWYSEADSRLPYVQRSEVKEIILHEAYKGDEQNHQNDAAILVLATPFKLSDSVHPVCIDLDNEDLNTVQVRPGRLGKVAGWDIRGTGKPSEELKTLESPVIEYNKCQMEMTNHHGYLTRDKLCAGYLNGSAVCQGDGGSGLVFPGEDNMQKTRWYLRGVVSVIPLDDDMTTCRASTYTVFTEIFKLKDWLSTQLKELK